MDLRNILILTALVSLTGCGLVPRSAEDQAADLAKVQACNAEGGYERTSPNGKFVRCAHNWSPEEQQLSYQMAVACLNGGGVDIRLNSSRIGFYRRRAEQHDGEARAHKHAI